MSGGYPPPGGGYPPPSYRPESGVPPSEGVYPLPPYEGGYPPPPPEGGYRPSSEGGVQDYGFPLQESYVSQPLLSSQSATVSFNVDSDQTPHYGQAPRRQPRRYKTTKRVKLSEGGNFVIDCPVPEKLLQQVRLTKDREFTHMRYTACTCKPDEFRDQKYVLRQPEFNPPRHTELFIVLTMYNEDEILFARTFHGVVKNIVHLCSRDRSRVWGTDGWKKVVVCIVSDGRAKINRRTLAYLAAIGVYQEGIAKNYVESISEDGKKVRKEVTAHIYEYTTQLSIDPEMNIKNENIVPIQVLFCLKEKNAKKINSHRWFFNAFGATLNPNVCVLLDVGTKPGSSSIYHLWKAFDINSNVAGACGEIVAMKGRAWSNLLNPIVACQNFEYKMSNILDKPLESVFGYITVLPGAFSAYRYVALQNDDNGLGPLHSYFLGEAAHAPPGEGGDKKKEEKDDIFTANMYLAEDRILCFELVAKRDCSWVLHYVKSAFAETDVPDQVPELISQRRRWLNGSFFAGVYAIYNTFAIWRSSHNIIRKIFLHIEMLYQSYNLLFSWFALGNFYLTFYILGNSLTDSEVIQGLWSQTMGDVMFQILRYVYLTLLIIQFIMALGNRPQGSKWAYITSIIFFSFLMLYMLFAAGWLTYKGVALQLDKQRGTLTGANMSTASAILGNSTFRNIILSVVSTYGLYFIASFLFFEPWHMFTSLGQYLLLVPFYINILNVYAFCNVHDVSWGTKGDNAPSKNLGSAKVGSGKSEVEVEVPVEQKDISEAYDEAVEELRQHVEEEVKHRSAEEKREDYNKSFRTRVVLSWILSNAALVAAITSADETLSKMLPQDKRSNDYMAFILWSVTGLAAFRFCGSCTFLLFRAFTGD